MATHPVLSGTDLTNATTGASAASWYLVAVQDVPVADATITVVNLIDQVFTVTSTSANWTDAQPNMVVEVLSPGGASRGLFRIRWGGVGATTIRLEELSYGDNGAIATTIRTAGIQAGDSLVVYNRREPWSIKPYIDASAGIVHEDYDKPSDLATYAENNHPAPINNVKIANAAGRTSYGDMAFFVDNGQAYATVTLTALPYLWPTSSSVASYAWTVPTAWGSPTAGSAASSSVTYHVPAAGVTNYVYGLNIVDDATVGRVGYRNLWVVDHASNPPLSVTTLDSIEVSESGVRASITIVDDGLADIPATGSKVFLFHDGTFNSAVIPSAWPGLSGWVLNVSEETADGLRTARIDIGGPQELLTKLGSYTQIVTAVSGTPANYQECVKSLATMDFQAYWVALLRAQLIDSINWTPLGLTYTDQDLPIWKLDAVGNLFGQMQEIAKVRQASFGFNPDGEAMLRKFPYLVPYADRATDVITRISIDSSIYSKITFNKEPRPKVRRCRAEALTWDGSATQPTPLLADAPGAAPGQGTGDERLQSQVANDQDELNQIGGDYWAYLNNPYPSIDIEVPGLLGLLVYPAEQSFIGVSVAAADSPDGVAKDLNVIVRSVSLRDEGGGAFTTVLNGYAETAGAPARTVVIPAQAVAETPYTSPPPTPTPDTFGIPSHDGRTVIVSDDTKITVTFNWGTGSENYYDITGNFPGGLLSPIQFDPFSPFFTTPGSSVVGLYAITSGGLYYCANAITSSPNWVRKGVYTADGGWAVLKVSAVLPGWVFLLRIDGFNGNQTVVEWYSSYGLNTEQRITTLGGTGGMDINPFDKEMLYVAISSLNRFGVYRDSLAGNPLLVDMGAVGNIEWLQRPLLNFTGTANIADSSEVWYMHGGLAHTLWRVTGGGATVTDITPTPGFSIGIYSTSIAYVSDARRLIVGAANASSHVFTSIDAGDTWTDCGAVGDGFVTMGYFPRLLNGNYAIYAGQTANLYYSGNFGASWQDTTGDWATAIGTPSAGFITVLPCY